MAAKKPVKKPVKKVAAPAKKSAAPKKAAAKSAAVKSGVAVMIGTKKGVWFLRSDAKRKSWKTEGPHFLGHIVHHVVMDPRDNKTLMVAARTGHLGPTLYRSRNMGKSWDELSAGMPKFKAGELVPGKDKPRVVDHVFWLEPGHASEPGTWYAGTSPAALFRTRDHGETWTALEGFNNGPHAAEWLVGDGTPDGQTLHSINVDPRDARRLYVGCSGGGVFTSDDAGETWRPFNKGIAANFVPKEVEETMEFGHDPHCVRLHPQMPDRLYQQNHCGIYRIDRPNERWERIGDNMPKSVGDIGFPVVLHPRNPDFAWVFPMDGSTVWPRVSPGGKAAVFRTSNAGKTWKRQDKGLPTSQGWLTVKRQAMCADVNEPLGVYFGTSSGEVWASTDEGDSWKCIARHLPHIYSVTSAATKA